MCNIYKLKMINIQTLYLYLCGSAVTVIIIIIISNIYYFVALFYDNFEKWIFEEFYARFSGTTLTKIF